jgi:hypothetical protein
MKPKIQTTFKNRASAVSKDVVGMELGAGLPQGVPVVRLHVTKKHTELLAAGFVKLNDHLPDTQVEPELETNNWALPKEFQASKAAIAVTSPMAVLRQTSDTGEKESGVSKIRKVSVKTDRHHPPIVSSMPDFMAAWIAARFPEGRRPTTRSIQTSMSAALNCFMCGPVMPDQDKPALAVFCFKHQSSIAVFFEGRLILYREHPVGYMTIKESISKKMNIDVEMVDTLMNDPVVDISPIIEPPLNALFRQVDISADYLSRRKNSEINDYYIYGIPSGVKHWTQTFKKVVGKQLHHLHPFGGISCSHKRLLLPDSFEKDAPLFMSAIGAARALLEDL